MDQTRRLYNVTTHDLCHQLCLVCLEAVMLVVMDHVVTTWTWLWYSKSCLSWRKFTSHMGMVLNVLFDEGYIDGLLISSVKNCGMNFDWSLFKFTQRDCSLLAKVLENFRQSGWWTHRSMFMKIQDWWLMWQAGGWMDGWIAIQTYS